LFLLVLSVEDNGWEKLIQGLVREGVLRSPRVIETMRKVSREKFLPENMRAHSAVDSPLPIGFGQTASAPHSGHVVAG
jgi:protein-L-isoaspartate(D-aspartate) O-methyltransferase